MRRSDCILILWNTDGKALSEGGIAFDTDGIPFDTDGIASDTGDTASIAVTGVLSFPRKGIPSVFSGVTGSPTGGIPFDTDGIPFDTDGISSDTDGIGFTAFLPPGLMIHGAI